MQHSLRRIIGSVLLAWFGALGNACWGDPSFNGRSADDWASTLAARSASDRVAAATAFANAPPHRLDHLRPLLIAANDPDTSVRRATDNALRNLLPKATKALVRALDDSNVVVRRTSAIVLGRIRDATKQQVSALVRATHDSDDSVRTLAVLSLGHLASGAYDAVDLIRRLATRPGPQRAPALLALPNIDTESRSLLAAYLPALDDTSAAVRSAAVWELPAAVGDAGVDLVPLVAKPLRDPDERVRLAAVRTIALLAQRDSTARSVLESVGPSNDTAFQRVADSAIVALKRRESKTARPVPR